MLAVVLAVALLLAPVGGLRAMPCHDHAGHGAGATSLQMAPDDLGHGQTGSHQCDHQACCGNPCSLCFIGVALQSETPLIRAAALQRYFSANQLGVGLALPPALDPPRIPA